MRIAEWIVENKIQWYFNQFCLGIYVLKFLNIDVLICLKITFIEYHLECDVLMFKVTNQEMISQAGTGS